MNAFLKMRAMLNILIACFVSNSFASDTNSIIGYWRTTKVEGIGMTKYITDTEVMHFATNGVVSIRFRNSANSEPETVDAKFSVFPKDRLNIKFGDARNPSKLIMPTKLLTAYRYHLVGNELQMEHLQFPMTNTLERVDNFTF
ncbi:MAG: hypothetical protein ABSH48_12090 [Verrucomicrobiota bacterium]